MTQSGATPSLPVSRDLLRVFGRGSPDWTRIGACVRGPLLTVAAVVVLDVMRRHDIGLISPFPVLILAVVYSAYVGGLRPALVSVTVSLLYALHFFAEPGLPLHYSAVAGHGASSRWRPRPWSRDCWHRGSTTGFGRPRCPSFPAWTPRPCRGGSRSSSRDRSS